MPKTKTTGITLMKNVLNLFLFAAFLFNGLATRADDAPQIYGAWHAVEGWPDLQWHVKRVEYNSDAKKYHWNIEFKNDYTKTITFECGMGETGTTPPLHDELTIKAGSTGWTWYLIGSHDNVAVTVGKVHFGN